MDSGYYAAVSGWVARNQAVDTAAANLANAQTSGFRAGREYFRSILVADDANESQVGQALNRFGLVGGTRLSSTQGPRQRTGNALDMAVEGAGFFAIQSSNGLRLTRDGSFHRSQSGLLVTSTGDPVLSETKQQIPIPPGEVAVGADGSLSVSGAIFGTLGVFEVSDAAQLKAEGANRYVLTDQASLSPSRTSVVHQGELEGSNQDVIGGSLDLLLMQRQTEMMQKALMVFHTEFNKLASEDLPRV